jgi:aspartate/methionine/tyrosine aminotransferase
MKLETFELERFQSLWENKVEYNLTDSGVHALRLQDVLNRGEIEELVSLPLGYGQTNGSIALREAISRLYPGTTAENILVTNGTAEANYIAMWSNLEPGDEVLYMIPNYLQIWGIAKSFGVNVKTFSLKAERGWQIDLEEIESQISACTKMLIICNPNNPTGAVMGDKERQGVLEIAEKTDTWIFADEIYRGAELNGIETESFWGGGDKVMVSGGLSKSYALPGLRIGWLVGSEDIANKAWAYHDYTSIATNILSNWVATLVLQPETRQKILKRNRGVLNHNLNVLTQWMKTHGDLFELIPPKAGGMAFTQYHKNINSSKLVQKIRDEKGVLLVAGDFFNLDHFLRIGIGAEESELREGLRRLADTLKSID